MRQEITDAERKLLGVIQHGMPDSLTPYRDMAEQIGVETEDVLEILKKWKSDGRLRRAGAIVSHFRVGVPAGAMVVWKVPADRIEEVGQMFGNRAEVSHAYERPEKANWPWNLYTMVHGQSDEEVDGTLASMSEAAGIDTFKKLNTVKELKKVPPTYVIEK